MKETVVLVESSTHFKHSSFREAEFVLGGCTEVITSECLHIDALFAIAPRTIVEDGLQRISRNKYPHRFIVHDNRYPLREFHLGFRRSPCEKNTGQTARVNLRSRTTLSKRIVQSSMMMLIGFLERSRLQLIIHPIDVFTTSA